MQIPKKMKYSFQLKYFVSLGLIFLKSCLISNRSAQQSRISANTIGIFERKCVFYL